MSSNNPSWEVIWVTGASSGIGRALSVELARVKDCRLILSGRDHERLESLKNEIGQDRACIYAFELTGDAAMEEHVQSVQRLWGRIDRVVLSAGVSQRSFVLDTDFSVYQKIFDINFFSNVRLAKALLPLFLEQGRGAFHVVSSVVGKFGTPWRSAYSASKHALHGFFDSLRAEVYNKNIKVQIICPGFVNTQISYNALNEHGEKTGVLDKAQAHGLSAEAFAMQMVRKMFSTKQEVFIGGGKERFGLFLKRFFPEFFASFVARSKVR